VVSKFLGWWQFVDLAPSQLCNCISRRRVHRASECEIIEDQMPSLIVSHERLDLCEFQRCIVYSGLFLQDALGSLFWVFQVMKIIVG
jgi:hypothetical protein